MGDRHLPMSEATPQSSQFATSERDAQEMTSNVIVAKIIGRLAVSRHLWREGEGNLILLHGLPEDV